MCSCWPCQNGYGNCLHFSEGEAKLLRAEAVAQAPAAEEITEVSTPLLMGELMALRYGGDIAEKQQARDRIRKRLGLEPDAKVSIKRLPGKRWVAVARKKKSEAPALGMGSASLIQVANDVFVSMTHSSPPVMTHSAKGLTINAAASKALAVAVQDAEDDRLYGKAVRGDDGQPLREAKRNPTSGRITYAVDNASEINKRMRELGIGQDALPVGGVVLDKPEGVKTLKKSLPMHWPDASVFWDSFNPDRARALLNGQHRPYSEIADDILGVFSWGHVPHDPQMGQTQWSDLQDYFAKEAQKNPTATTYLNPYCGAGRALTRILDIWDECHG